MFHEVICMYETLLLNIRMKLMQNKRSNGELKELLHEMFEDNSIEFNKLKSIYSKPTIRTGENIFGKIEFEHNEIEKLKKRMYGDKYEIKPFPYQ